MANQTQEIVFNIKNQNRGVVIARTLPPTNTKGKRIVVTTPTMNPQLRYVTSWDYGLNEAPNFEEAFKQALALWISEGADYLNNRTYVMGYTKDGYALVTL